MHGLPFGQALSSHKFKTISLLDIGKLLISKLCALELEDAKALYWAFSFIPVFLVCIATVIICTLSERSFSLTLNAFSGSDGSLCVTRMIIRSSLPAGRLNNF